MLTSGTQGTQRILIVGAGIAGLALARCFDKFNIQYLLIDKNPQLSSEGAGIALPANAVKALRHLDLHDQVLAHAHRVQKIIYTKPSGDILSEDSLLTPPFNTEPFVALHRRQLHRILQAEVKGEIHLNSSIKEIAQAGDGVTVQFDSATLSEEKFSAVVGADGINSTVRKSVFGEIPLVDFGVSNWRWTCPYPTRGLQPTYMLGAQDVFMAYPISENEVYCYAQIYDPKGTFVKTGRDHRRFLNKYFHPYAGIARALLPLLPDTSSIIPGRLRSVPRPFFTQGRVALVGDAGKACSPTLQQGAACAFEDIVLSEMLNNFHLDEAFSHYQEYRESRVRWIVEASDMPMKSLPAMNSFFSLFKRNLYIQYRGPFNVQGWKKLLSIDPLAELPAFIEQKKESPHSMYAGPSVPIRTSSYRRHHK